MNFQKKFYKGNKRNLISFFYKIKTLSYAYDKHKKIKSGIIFTVFKGGNIMQLFIAVLTEADYVPTILKKF